MAEDYYISNKFILCSLFPHGEKQILRKSLKTTVCLTFAGIWDFLVNGVVKFGRRDTLEIISPLPEEMFSAKSLYNYIGFSKHMKYNKIIENFVLISGYPLNDYIDSVVDILVRDGSVSTKIKVSFFKSETLVPPKMDAFEVEMDRIKKEILGGGNISDNMIVLASLLFEIDFFKNYYSKSESEIIKTEINKSKQLNHDLLAGKFIHEINGTLSEIIKNG